MANGVVVRSGMKIKIVDNEGMELFVCRARDVMPLKGNSRFINGVIIEV